MISLEAYRALDRFDASEVYVQVHWAVSRAVWKDADADTDPDTVDFRAMYRAVQIAAYWPIEWAVNEAFLRGLSHDLP